MQSHPVKLTLFTLLLCLSCAKKQHHAITPPMWPNYVVSGYALDPDDLTPVTGARVELVQVHPLYACDSINVETTVDSAGFFEFFAICPGFYRFSCVRESVTTLTARFQLLHNDTTVTLFPPAPLFGERQKTGDNLTGLDWKNSHTLAYLGNPNPVRLFEGNMTRGFTKLGTPELITGNPPINGLVHMPDGYITFYGGLQNPSLARIDTSTGVVNYFRTAPHRLRDISSDGRFLWATTSKPSIVKLDPDENDQYIEFPSPLTHPQGIAAADGIIWTSDDGEEGCGRLFRHDPDLNILKTRCPFYRDDTDMPVFIFIKFLALRSDGTLWGIAVDGLNTEGIYKFIID
ncbi:carboxypeptidase regulatory-like domain-containing protein [candidate division KSB1 bacterium]|nr:carboxypeptidase regulatory-like domain-containing protein [candidate division KSB1 bacterium]